MKNINIVSGMNLEINFGRIDIFTMLILISPFI